MTRTFSEPAFARAVEDVVPVGREHDVVLRSEVIEHLPVPGHVAFSRLNAVLRPGGTLVLRVPRFRDNLLATGMAP